MFPSPPRRGKGRRAVDRKELGRGGGRSAGLHVGTVGTARAGGAGSISRETARGRQGVTGDGHELAGRAAVELGLPAGWRSKPVRHDATAVGRPAFFCGSARRSARAVLCRSGPRPWIGRAWRVVDRRGRRTRHDDRRGTGQHAAARLATDKKSSANVARTRAPGRADGGLAGSDSVH